MQARFRSFPPKLAALALALGASSLLEVLCTVEWSYPYCSNQDSGPAFAVTGMPLPYMHYSGVSSLEYLFMPHVYAANLFLLAALVYPVCRILATPGKVRV